MSKLLLVGENINELKNNLTQQGYEVNTLSIDSADTKKVKALTSDAEALVYFVNNDLLSKDKFYKIKDKIDSNFNKKKFYISDSSDLDSLFDDIFSMDVSPLSVIMNTGSTIEIAYMAAEI